MAQKLNPWPQQNHGGNGRATDNNIDTTEERSIAPGDSGSFSLLFNFWINLSGLYIQSSGDFVTDYHVGAVIGNRFSQVGRLCGATGNFTFVPLVNPEDGGSVFSNTLFVDVIAAKGNSSTAIINEIWPVFPEDEVFDPENTSPCPALLAK